MENDYNFGDADYLINDKSEICFSIAEYNEMLNCHQKITSSDINQYSYIFTHNTPSLTDQFTSLLNEEFIKSFFPSYEALNTLGSLIFFAINVYSNPYLSLSLVFFKLTEDLLELNSQSIINYFGFKFENVFAFKRFITQTRLSAGSVILGMNIAPVTGKKFGAGISAAAIDSIDNFIELSKMLTYPNSFLPHDQMDIFASGLYFQLKKSSEDFFKPICSKILRSDEKWLPLTNNIFIDTLIEEYVVVGTSKLLGTEVADYFNILEMKKNPDIHSFLSLEILTKAWLNLYNKGGNPYFVAIPLVMKQLQKFLFRDLR